MDADQVRPPHGAGAQLGVLLAPAEPIEQIVIRHLGMSLAQTQVDLAFALARIAAAKESVKRLMEAADPEDGLAPLLGSLFSLLG